MQGERAEDARQIHDSAGRPLRMSGKSVCVSATTAKKFVSKVWRSREGVTVVDVLKPPGRRSPRPRA